MPTADRRFRRPFFDALQLAVAASLFAVTFIPFCPSRADAVGTETAGGARAAYATSADTSASNASIADAGTWSSNGVPPALADLRGFRGRIDYLARRDGFPGAPPIVGSIVVGNRDWTIEERTDQSYLIAGSSGASLTSDGSSIAVDDVLDADPLANAWAAALGSIATQGIRPVDGNDRSWIASGFRLYFDVTGDHLIGISDSAGRDDVSYALDGWTTAGSLSLPLHVLRLRGGIPDAAYSVSDYRVTVALPDRPSSSKIGIASIGFPEPAHETTFRTGVAPDVFMQGNTWATALAFMLFAGLFAVVWTRRDAFLLTLCKTLARDVRGWRRAGISVFVEPDGVLTFDGARYRVGPHYYGRAVLVQCTALFIRVSAPVVPRPVILPRKFRAADLGVRPQPRRRASFGFSLLETLVATSLLAAVVLLAVYPAVIGVAHADAMAAERARAVVLASDALADEEAVDDYDNGAPQGSISTTSDGLTLTVTVAPGSMRGVSDLDVSVTDGSGAVLAHLVSWLGAPVKAPPDSTGGPPGG